MLALAGAYIQAPHFGSMLALAVVPLVLIAARGALLLLSRGGVVPAMMPQRHGAASAVPAHERAAA